MKNADFLQLRSFCVACNCKINFKDEYNPNCIPSYSLHFQGNSISIATIDISAGYIGLESYNALIAGGLTFLATYSGYLLWVLRLMVYISQHFSDR